MFLSFKTTFSLIIAAMVFGCPGEHFRLGFLIRYYSSQIFKSMYGLQFFVVNGNVSADAIGVVCYQLGLLYTDLYFICRGGLFKVILPT